MSFDRRPLEQHDIGELSHRIAALEERLVNVQSLVARGREEMRDEARIVQACRVSDSYSEAYEEEPPVSVRIATYKGSDVLARRALPSLLAQTYERWEAIVVGDATDDSTADVIARLGDPRIRFENLPVRGPYPSNPRALWYVAGTGPMNRGLEAADGCWIAALDHDDEWSDDHLEVLVTAARDSRAEVIYGRIEVRDDATGEPLGVMGSWPPVRGEFGFLGALVHVGLKGVQFDKHAYLADEPGDWNLAQRLWNAGARFAFVDQCVATHHAAGRGLHEGPDERTIAELRVWVEELDALRRKQVRELEAERDTARADLANVRAVIADLERSAFDRARERCGSLVRALGPRRRRNNGS